MKVLAVIVAHPLRKIAGATNAGRELSIALAELTNIELAIMWDKDESLMSGKLPIRHVRSSNPLKALESWLPRTVLVPLYGSRIPQIIEQGDYDLVHIHGLLPAFAAERIAHACLKRSIPYVITSHGFNEQSRYGALNGFSGIKKALSSWAIERPFRRVVKDATAIFSLSDREVELLSNLGVTADRVHVVSNGVNEYYLDQPSPEELEAVNAKFGLGTDPILLFMGSLHGYKGLDVFLRSLSQVKGSFQAVVAGAFKSDRERLAVLQQAGIPSELSQAIVFTNAVSDAELRALYHRAEVFVYPTKGDTLPLVLLEAMACRLPIVSTKVGGIPYMVGPEQGILVEPNEAGAVAEAVNELLGNPARRQAMGESAMQNVLSRFRWSQAAATAMRGYQLILESRAHLTKEAVSVHSFEDGY